MRQHLTEYAIEATLLGVFMVAATIATAALEGEGAALGAWVSSPFARRALIGGAMGLTAIALIYSRAGQRSGAHMNPAVTLAFWRLGKIDGADAAGYVGAHFAGAIAGSWLGAWLAWPLAGSGAARLVVTRPGPLGAAVAFVAEVLIAFGMMAVVLALSASRHARFTGLAAGLLVALYITFEAPLSGMSLNPARSVGSAVIAGEFDGLALYLVAPVLGMAVAAEASKRLAALPRCAKLHHGRGVRCIFRCAFHPDGDMTHAR